MPLLGVAARLDYFSHFRLLSRGVGCSVVLLPVLTHLGSMLEMYHIVLVLGRLNSVSVLRHVDNNLQSVESESTVVRSPDLGRLVIAKHFVAKQSNQS